MEEAEHEAAPICPQTRHLTRPKRDTAPTLAATPRLRARAFSNDTSYLHNDAESQSQGGQPEYQRSSITEPFDWKRPVFNSTRRRSYSCWKTPEFRCCFQIQPLPSKIVPQCQEQEHAGILFRDRTFPVSVPTLSEGRLWSVEKPRQGRKATAPAWTLETRFMAERRTATAPSKVVIHQSHSREAATKF